MSTKLYTDFSGQFQYQQVTPSPEIVVGVHHFQMGFGGKIEYYTPHVDNSVEVEVKGIQKWPVEGLGGFRLYTITPVEEEEVASGGGGGTAPWSRRDPKFGTNKKRRDLQDIMDLTSLLILSGILEE